MRGRWYNRKSRVAAFNNARCLISLTSNAPHRLREQTIRYVTALWLNGDDEIVRPTVFGQCSSSAAAAPPLNHQTHFVRFCFTPWKCAYGCGSSKLLLTTNGHIFIANRTVNYHLINTLEHRSIEKRLFIHWGKLFGLHFNWKLAISNVFSRGRAAAAVKRSESIIADSQAPKLAFGSRKSPIIKL